jgi:uncharacterized protein YceK
MKNQIFKAIILLSMLVVLSGCVTIICNSTSRQEKSEVFTDEATKNQAEKINNKGGLF